MTCRLGMTWNRGPSVSNACPQTATTKAMPTAGARRRSRTPEQRSAAWGCRRIRKSTGDDVETGLHDGVPFYVLSSRTSRGTLKRGREHYELSRDFSALLPAARAISLIAVARRDLFFRLLPSIG